MDTVGTGTPDPWTARVARRVLEGRKGVELKVLEVWPRSPIPPGEWLILVVEADVAGVDSKGPFTLRLWEAEGGRSKNTRFLETINNQQDTVFSP